MKKNEQTQDPIFFEQDSFKRTKNLLLKSGFPLEFDVAKISDNCLFSVDGDYKYIRKNENGIDTQFSVDILSEDYLIDSNRELLISVLTECKYSHEAKVWYFIPFPTFTLDYHTPVFSEFSCHEVEFRSDYHRFEGIDQYCYRGIELLNNDSNSKRIEHAIHQIQYAVPNLVVSKLIDQIMSRTTEDSRANLIFPVIVTNAKLRVFNHDSSIETIQNAASESEFSNQVDCILCSPGIDIPLNNYIHERLSEFSNMFKFDDFLGAMKKSNPTYSTSQALKNISDQISEACNHVFIVTKEYYPTLLARFSEVKKNSKIHKKFSITSSGEAYQIAWKA